MKKRFLDFFQQTDMTALLDRTDQLLLLEQPQTFEAYHASAAKAVELLREAGIPCVEKLTFPADGKTVWQDKISPLGWTAKEGLVKVVSAPGFAPGTVIADYQQHPFYLVKGSCGTSPGGEVLPLVSWEQVLAGQNPAGALVLSSLDQDCRCRALPRMLDLGARGVISDFSFNVSDAPEGILWNTALTEHDNWHVHAENRPFIAFSIPPATGKKLRQAVSQGEVLLHVNSDARRLESTFDLVTACIPGKRKEEFWIYAHLYEPMANDNSSGVASAIETARLLMQKGTPEFSLRLLFGLEHYGFAAYAVSRGDKNLSREVIGACDYDAMRVRKNWNIQLRCAPPGTPFYGNYLLHQIPRELQGLPEAPEITCLDAFACMYDDDVFLSDSTTGVPTIWPIREGEGLYHNSLQTIDFIEPEALRFACALNTVLIDSFINPEKTMAEQALLTAQQILRQEFSRSVGSPREHLARRYEILHQDLANFSRFLPDDFLALLLEKLRQTFEELQKDLGCELPQSPWRKKAEKFLPVRLTTGFPFDLAKVPFKERILLPGSVLYGPLAGILANMDGVSDLGTVIRKTEHETCSLLSDEQAEELLDALFYLAEYGYISLVPLK